MARHNVPAQINNGLNLFGRKGNIAEFMAGIDDFNAD